MPKRSLAPQRGFFPQPAYLIGAFKDDGTPNFTLITLVTFCSVEPPILAFATRGDKLTPGLAREKGLFSANLVTAKMMHLADFCGTTSGATHDKCAETGAAWARGAVLDVPVLDESPWVFECALVDTIRQGDGTIYFGEVRNILVDGMIRETAYGRVDLATLDPLIYAPGHYYALGPCVGRVGDSRAVFPGRV